MKTKRGVSLPADFTGWFILGIVILVVVILISMTLSGKLSGGLDSFKKILRFGNG
jgi:hypothetical protein